MVEALPEPQEIARQEFMDKDKLVQYCSEGADRLNELKQRVENAGAADLQNIVKQRLIDDLREHARKTSFATTQDAIMEAYQRISIEAKAEVPFEESRDLDVVLQLPKQLLIQSFGMTQKIQGVIEGIESLRPELTSLNSKMQLLLMKAKDTSTYLGLTQEAREANLKRLQSLSRHVMKAQQAFLSDFSSEMRGIQESYWVLLGGVTRIDQMPSECLVRKTPMVGYNKENVKDVKTWPEDEKLFKSLADESISQLEIKRFSYQAGDVFRTMQFFSANKRCSQKIGSVGQFNVHYDFPAAQLVKITVSCNPQHLTALIFEFEDGTVYRAEGKFATNERYGVNTLSEFQLATGEKLVGVTTEEDSQRPKRIGFTILRTI